MSSTRRVVQYMRFVRRQSANIAAFAYTMFLFLKSDIGTVILPTMSLGISLIGVPEAHAFLEGLIWVILHLLAFDVSHSCTCLAPYTKIIGLEEDRLSKPHRPIAAGRISVQTSQRLHIVLTVASLLVSMRRGLLVHSASFFVLITMYNDGNLSSSWIMKSGIIAVCIGILCSGVVACFDHDRPLSLTSMHAVILTVLIQATTLHAQDFRDMAGDAVIGRKTLPMILPRALARWGIGILLLTWSTILVAFWDLPAGATLVLYGLAGYTACSFRAGGTICGLLLAWLCHSSTVSGQ
ncbi:UbiA prenyltransferase family-domain-containing protein [Schizophyllum commune]